MPSAPPGRVFVSVPDGNIHWRGVRWNLAALRGFQWTANAAADWADSHTVDKSVLGDGRIRLTWTWEEKKTGFVMVVR